MWLLIGLLLDYCYHHGGCDQRVSCLIASVSTDPCDDTEMESAVSALFGDVLKTGERIIIQVE